MNITVVGGIFIILNIKKIKIIRKKQLEKRRKKKKKEEKKSWKTNPNPKVEIISTL